MNLLSTANTLFQNLPKAVSKSKSCPNLSQSDQTERQFLSGRLDTQNVSFRNSCENLIFYDQNYFSGTEANDYLLWKALKIRQIFF